MPQSRMRPTKSEVWLCVPGFVYYEVSDCGRVRSYKGTNGTLHKEPHILAPDLSGPYPRYTLRRWPELGKFRENVHILVLLTFVGPRPPGAIGRHLDDDPSNNTPGNLAWGTHKDNEADKKRNGNSLIGERHHRASITEETALAVIEDIAKYTGYGAGAYIMEKHNLSRSAYRHIKAGNSWKHLRQE